MELTTDTTAGPGVRQRRIAEAAQGPTRNDIERIRKGLPDLPNAALLPPELTAAIAALDEAELAAMDAVDEVAVTRQRIQRAKADDAVVLRDAARDGKDLAKVDHQANQAKAHDEHERAIAVARARISVAHERAGDVRRVATESATGIALAARAHMDDVAAKHVAAVEAFTTSRSAYFGAVADCHRATRYAASCDYDAASEMQFDTERTAAADAVWSPNVSGEVKVGSHRIAVGDLLAGIVVDSQRHVEPEPRKQTGDDKRLTEHVKASTRQRKVVAV